MYLGVRWRDRSVRGGRKAEDDMGAEVMGVLEACVYCRIDIPLLLYNECFSRQGHEQGYEQG